MLLTYKELVYVDVGAANFVETPISSFHNNIKVITFEPDERSRIELEKLGVNVFQYGLSDIKETVNLHLTKKAECSSVLKPNHSAIEMFPNADRFQVLDSAAISCLPLDDFNLNVDFLKIDTQGMELKVLKGASRTLKDCTCVQVEVYFQQFYIDQPLFSEIDEFMRSNDFVLLDLVDQKYFASDGYYGAGQLIFCDAIYIKDASKIKFDIESAYKHSLAYIAFENYGRAIELIKRFNFTELYLIAHKLKKRQFNRLLREHWLRMIKVIK